MLHSTTRTTFWEREGHRQQPERHRRDLEHPHQKNKRHHHQRLENRHQGLEHYRKKLECPCQELHLLLRPETHIILRLGANRMYRITRPPVQGPTQESSIRSTTRTRQKHRGQSHRPRVWSSPTPKETRFGSRRTKTG